MFEGINWQQYRALVHTMILVQLRGRTGKSKYGRLLSVSGTYVIASSYLGWSLTRAYYEPAFLLLTFSVMLYIAGFTFIGSYPLILLDENDRGILQQFPVTASTLSAARITNLVIYILFVSLPFIIPLALIFLWNSTGILPAILYAFFMLAAAMWSTLFFLNLTLKMLQRSPKYHVLLSVLQMLLVFSLLIFYQAMPRYFLHKVPWDTLFANPFTYVLPPFWFVGSFQAALGTEQYLSFLPHATLALLTGLILLYMISRSWSIPVDAVKARNRSAGTGLLKLVDSVVFRFMRSSSARAGYSLIAGIAFRERSFRLQILPMALMPIAVVVYGQLSGQLASPFPQLLTGWYSKVHIAVLMFYLYVGRHCEHVVFFSPAREAQWMMHTTKNGARQSYRSGVYTGIRVYVLLPIAAAVTLLFTISMPLPEALLQGAFLFISAVCQSSLFMLFSKHIPFSADANQLEAFHRISQIFLVVPFLILFWLLHYFTSTSYISFSIMLLALATASTLMHKVSRQGTLKLPAW
jgi:hypothetical protein